MSEYGPLLTPTPRLAIFAGRRSMLARAARAGRISSIPSRALSSAVQRGAQDFHELRERSLLRYTLKASTEGDALSVIDAMDALCAWLRVEPARRDALTPRPRR